MDAQKWARKVLRKLRAVNYETGLTIPPEIIDFWNALANGVTNQNAVVYTALLRGRGVYKPGMVQQLYMYHPTEGCMALHNMFMSHIMTLKGFKRLCWEIETEQSEAFITKKQNEKHRPHVICVVKNGQLLFSQQPVIRFKRFDFVPRQTEGHEKPTQELVCA